MRLSTMERAVARTNAASNPQAAAARYALSATRDAGYRLEVRWLERCLETLADLGARFDHSAAMDIALGARQYRSEQEVYDTVVTHIRAQQRPSVAQGDCYYHGPNGLKCAIGTLIPQSWYSPAMEGVTLDAAVQAWASVDGAQALYEALNAQGIDVRSSLLRELQDAHDINLTQHGLSSFESRVKLIASVHGLRARGSFSEVKKGDVLYCKQLGRVEVVCVANGTSCPITVRYADGVETLTADG